jgi:hypothetical protein
MARGEGGDSPKSDSKSEGRLPERSKLVAKRPHVGALWLEMRDPVGACVVV